MPKGKTTSVIYVKVSATSAGNLSSSLSCLSELHDTVSAMSAAAVQHSVTQLGGSPGKATTHARAAPGPTDGGHALKMDTHCDRAPSPVTGHQACNVDRRSTAGVPHQCDGAV